MSYLQDSWFSLKSWAYGSNRRQSSIDAFGRSNLNSFQALPNSFLQPSHYSHLSDSLNASPDVYFEQRRWYRCKIAFLIFYLLLLFTTLFAHLYYYFSNIYAPQPVGKIFFIITISEHLLTSVVLCILAANHTSILKTLVRCLKKISSFELVEQVYFALSLISISTCTCAQINDSCPSYLDADTLFMRICVRSTHMFRNLSFFIFADEVENKDYIIPLCIIGFLENFGMFLWMGIYKIQDLNDSIQMGWTFPDVYCHDFYIMLQVLPYFMSRYFLKGLQPKYSVHIWNYHQIQGAPLQLHLTGSLASLFRMSQYLNALVILIILFFYCMSLNPPTEHFISDTAYLISYSILLGIQIPIDLFSIFLLFKTRHWEEPIWPKGRPRSAEAVIYAVFISIAIIVEIVFMVHLYITETHQSNFIRGAESVCGMIEIVVFMAFSDSIVDDTYIFNRCPVVALKCLERLFMMIADPRDWLEGRGLIFWFFGFHYIVYFKVSFYMTNLMLKKLLKPNKRIHGEYVLRTRIHRRGTFSESETPTPQWIQEDVKYDSSKGRSQLIAPVAGGGNFHNSSNNSIIFAPDETPEP